MLSAIDLHNAKVHTNIWATLKTPLPISASGTLNFPAKFGFSLQFGRATVTDHAPTWTMTDPVTMLT